MSSTPDAIDRDLAKQISATPFIDTHEHIVEERDRVDWKPFWGVPCNDWAALLNGYLGSDLVSAGMSAQDQGKLWSSEVAWHDKWPLVEPFWPFVRHTGYGRSLREALRVVYDIDDLNAGIIETLQERYLEMIRPGFYPEVLCKLAGIESCQVNSLQRMFSETAHPTLLMQDISFLQMHQGPNIQAVAEPTGIDVRDLGSFHRAIDWWFDTYADYAVAVKCQAAYSRRLDYEDVPAERAEGAFARLIDGAPLSAEERKPMEDHLFWYAVRKATEHRLPVKLHTGYYAGANGMPLARLTTNPGDVSELLRQAPDTTFVLMHICYPYHEEMIALAKQWSNAVIDMCWAWIINPEASARFLRDFIVTAPSSKVLTFGGDYLLAEQSVGHAVVARQGLALALSQLVNRGWITRHEAMELVGPLMHGNARRIFDLDRKTEAAGRVPW